MRVHGLVYSPMCKDCLGHLVEERSVLVLMDRKLSKITSASVGWGGWNFDEEGENHENK